mgnify:CR=1 FL=1
MATSQEALKAIQKKLIGKRLNYREIYSIMDEIAHDRLGDILTTYFAASGYSKGFSYDEIYFLTRAMVETGDRLKFEGIVADKHSIGGVPGTRATMVIIPIVAAAGFKIPKSSSRAITTPAGTADCMETIAKVDFEKEEIYKIIEKTNGCIVWGGRLNLAPADYEIINVEEPLLLESFDKILVSVMAKKIAFGSTHVVIDIPYGRFVKVHHKEDGENLARKFKFLASKFDIKLEAVVSQASEPAGNGVGPLLEARDALKVLERTNDRPMALEKKSLKFASHLLSLCLSDSSDIVKSEFSAKYKDTSEWASDVLTSGRAHKKMMEIVQAQKGDPEITSDKLKPSGKAYEVKAQRSGIIKEVNSKNITILAKILGAPEDHGAGLFLHKKIGDKVSNREIIVDFYSQNENNSLEANDSLEMFPIYEIE